MTTCSLCGSPIADGAVYCDNCGAPVSRRPDTTEPTDSRRVQDRSDMRDQPDLLILMGSAEDGIPLAISISRSTSVTASAWKLVDSLGRSHPIGRQLQSPLGTIERTLDSLWVQRGIYPLSLPSGVTLPCYVSRKSLSDLLGSSLLGLLIPPLPAASGESKTGSKAVATATQRLAAAQREATGQPEGTGRALASTGGQGRFLALSVEDQKVLIIGWEDESKRDAPTFQRAFTPESLTAFSDCTFQVLRQERYNYQASPPVVASGSITTFPVAMCELLEKTNSAENRVYFEPRFAVPYTSVARMIVQIAQKLEERYHRSGKVHADLKPQNILLTVSGPRLIDDLGLGVGDISPAVSPGWGAPEQLNVQQTVQRSTDVYPIGVMLVSLLKGQITGEIVNYAIPSSRGTPRMVTFIREPMVYLDPSQQVVPQGGIMEWLTFIERCLNLNPDSRFVSGGECARELGALLAKHPLQGQIEFSLKDRGEIGVATFSDSSEGPCRVISDLPYE